MSRLSTTAEGSFQLELDRFDERVANGGTEAELHEQFLQLMVLSGTNNDQRLKAHERWAKVLGREGIWSVAAYHFVQASMAAAASRQPYSCATNQLKAAWTVYAAGDHTTALIYAERAAEGFERFPGTDGKAGADALIIAINGDLQTGLGSEEERLRSVISHLLFPLDTFDQ